MKYFHAANRPGAYFEGWYFKFQATDGKALALIPACHTDPTGRYTASLQVISDDMAWWLEYPKDQFHAMSRVFRIHLGSNVFAESGAWISVEEEGLALSGELRFRPFHPLRSDIMGPFRFLPGMECSHGVISMGHLLEGSLTLNGKRLDLSGGMGYIETDRGRSFPSRYLWTQCGWMTDRIHSFMLSIAVVPLYCGSITGCICALCLDGREYRLATYYGARVEAWSDLGAVIRQGPYRLAVERLGGMPRPLRAPVRGAMSRTIHESLCSVIRLRFWDGDRLVLDHQDECAGFEYADT